MGFDEEVARMKRAMTPDELAAIGRMDAADIRAAFAFGNALRGLRDGGAALEDVLIAVRALWRAL